MMFLSLMFLSFYPSPFRFLSFSLNLKKKKKKKKKSAGLLVHFEIQVGRLQLEFLIRNNPS